MRIIILGHGNVATNLYQAFQRQHIRVDLHSSRVNIDNLPNDADVYIYAVRDEALPNVIASVHVSPKALHLHTSGTMPLSVFGNDKPHCGIFYPFQSFSKDHPINDFTQVPVFIEANGIDTISGLYALAQSITPHVWEITQHEREKLHVAGVFANNFSNLMYRMAADILANTHIPFSILYPIIDETASKIHTLTPLQAQTGPARRGDTRVMQQHLNVLTSDEQRNVYILLSKLIEQAYNH